MVSFGLHVAPSVGEEMSSLEQLEVAERERSCRERRMEIGRNGGAKKLHNGSDVSISYLIRIYPQAHDYPCSDYPCSFHQRVYLGYQIQGTISATRPRTIQLDPLGKKR
jgi:hypothetical protein